MTTVHSSWLHEPHWDALYRHATDIGSIPWYDLDCSDLGTFVASLELPLSAPCHILDVGAGLALRSMIALRMNPRWNTPGVHVTCTDISLHAVTRATDLWSRAREGLPVHPQADHLPPPQFTMSFHHNPAASLRADLLRNPPDIIIDWMTLHGLDPVSRTAYLAHLRAIKPQWILLKCFSSEHGTLRVLPQSVPGVDKSQFSDSDIIDLFQDHYEVAGPVQDWPEDLAATTHCDGPIAAKRAYALRRVSPRAVTHRIV